MNIFWAFILGTLQGLTEFFPVSSSGHLVIAQALIPNFTQPGVLFDVVLHGGTLFAILIYFRKRIVKISKDDLRLLVIGTIPAVLVGLFFRSEVESLFSDTKVVGMALLVTGIFNYYTDKAKSNKKKNTPSNALVIGLYQAFAIIPGISRSGSTIHAGTKAGLSRKKAAEFSFLLSVPAVLGANVLQFMSYSSTPNINPLLFATGFLSALVFGYLAILWVMKLLEMKQFRIFAYYCFTLGVIVLLFL